MMNKVIYRGDRFPAEIIRRAVWLHYRFTLSDPELGNRGLLFLSIQRSIGSRD
jgi:transposase-like protein